MSAEMDTYYQALDTSYLSKENRQILNEDAWHEAEIRERYPDISVFFRPGDRTDTSHPVHWHKNEDGISYIRFVTTYGSHASKTEPLYSTHGFRVRVISRVAKPLSDISEDELQNSYHESASHEGVISFLRKKYPDMTELLSGNPTLTVYHVEYIDKYTEE